jgi:hypothetical protein
LLEMGLEDCENAMPIRRAHLAGEGGHQFRFDEPTDCPVVCFVQRSLGPPLRGSGQ